MSDNTVKEFLSICEDFDNAMLVTHGTEGDLVARPMVIANLDADGDLWFATDSGSMKVDEILAQPQVCVTLAGDGNFAAISGRAEVVTDRERIKSLWNESWKVWFPDGPTDPRIALIHVHAEMGEYWSNSGANRLKYLFEAAKSYVTGARGVDTDDQQHAKVDL